MSRAVKHSIALFVFLAVAWLLWSGFWDNPLLLSLGAVSCLGVLLLVRRMRLVDAEGVPLKILPKLVVYAPWLIWEVVKANVDVARRILSPRMPISPCLFEVKASQSDDLGRVIYANSITLTPGTISVHVEGDVILVHALTKEAADGVEEAEMDRRVTGLAG